MLRLIGAGNRWRGDDGAGLLVAELVAAARPAGVETIGHGGEPIELIERFAGARAVWLIDAVRSGAPAGTVHRFDAGERPLPATAFRASTHHIGLAEVVEIARALARLPDAVLVFGIEGACFDTGAPMSAAVTAAAAGLAGQLVEEAARCVALLDRRISPPSPRSAAPAGPSGPAALLEAAG